MGAVCWLFAMFSQVIPNSPIKWPSNTHVVKDTKAQRGEATCLQSHSCPPAPSGSKPSFQAGGPSTHLGVARASRAPQPPEGTLLQANSIYPGGLVAQSCPTLETPWTVARQAPLSWDFPGKNTAVGCHFLLQGISWTQGSNPGLLHSRRILYQLSCDRSPS